MYVPIKLIKNPLSAFEGAYPRMYVYAPYSCSPGRNIVANYPRIRTTIAASEHCDRLSNLLSRLGITALKWHMYKPFHVGEGRTCHSLLIIIDPNHARPA